MGFSTCLRFVCCMLLCFVVAVISGCSASHTTEDPRLVAHGECSVLSDSEKIECYTQHAKAFEDVRICNELWGGAKVQCYSLVAIESGDESVCAFLDDSFYCYGLVAWENKDRSFCNGISGDQRDHCHGFYDQLASKEGATQMEVSRFAFKGTRFLYPSSWETTPIDNGLIFSPPGGEEVSVSVLIYGGVGSSEEFTSQMVSSLQGAFPSGEVINSRRVFLDGEDASSLSISVGDEVKEYMWHVRDGNGYVLILSSPRALYSSSVSVYQEMVKSFVIEETDLDQFSFD